MEKATIKDKNSILRELGYTNDELRKALWKEPLADLYNRFQAELLNTVILLSKEQNKQRLRELSTVAVAARKEKARQRKLDDYG